MDHPSDPASIPDDLLIRDPLTGSYTRGLLEPRLTEELARAEREISPLVVCHFDLDHFGQYNQEFSFDHGNQVLKDAAHWTYQSIRTSDLLFRSGGDEFVLLLPTTTREQAMVVCQRILERFEQGPVSISMGVASYPEDGDQTHLLLDTAHKRHLVARTDSSCKYVTHEHGDSPRIYFNTQIKPVERETAFEALQGFLQELPNHQQGLLLIDSDAQAGRTFFLRQAALLAQQHNYLVLPLVFSAETAEQQILAETQVLQSLLDEVEHTGKTGLLVLYDGPADVPASILVRVFQQHDTSRPLGVVALGKPEEAPQVSLSHTLKLEPFSKQGLHRWVRDVFHWDAPEAFIQQLLQATQGYPARAEMRLKTLLDAGILHYTGGTWKLREDADAG
ncbi:GGDEF domain-containing protein [Deinococcus roseus]|uniref:GGDEF domain-containing protein n=1 Tax=Deinococcus roseus TaxID=392414 RepID=A0ABQ2CW18_9DEIO|nr:GGDEF domain-containing protein [Deinococcus roseus]GGJ26375.1 hypothetical protein GCM10008938_10680 [Deinococcus roseus]